MLFPVSSNLGMTAPHRNHCPKTPWHLLTAGACCSEAGRAGHRASSGSAPCDIPASLPAPSCSLINCVSRPFVSRERAAVMEQPSAAPAPGNSLAAARAWYRRYPDEVIHHREPGQGSLAGKREDGNHRRQTLNILCRSGCCIRSLEAVFLLLLQKDGMRPLCPMWMERPQYASIEPVRGKNEPCPRASSAPRAGNGIWKGHPFSRSMATGDECLNQRCSTLGYVGW